MSKEPIAFISQSLTFCFSWLASHMPSLPQAEYFSAIFSIALGLLSVPHYISRSFQAVKGWFKK
jgi:hypothetical protein